MKKIRALLEPLFCVAVNLLVAMLLLSITRILFILENAAAYPGVCFGHFAYLCKAGLRFDLSAMFYVNSIYIVLALLPLAARTGKVYKAVTKFFYVVPNFLALAVNLVDSVYFQFTGRRTTCSFFSEFKNESNLGSIFFQSCLEHWYLVLAGLAMLAILIFLFKHPKTGCRQSLAYTIAHSIVLLACIYPIILGIRGGAGVMIRPLSINDATAYADTPAETSIVLNTPICLIRTVSRSSFTNPEYYQDTEEMLSQFNSLVTPEPGTEFRPLNVCVIILESFSSAYSERITGLQGHEAKGYMPFLDSLMNESLTFRYSFANGRKSIEAIQSVLSGIPSLIEPFTISPYATNAISGLAGELCANKGYSSAFIHGAPRGSMGFEAFTHISGFQQLYDKETFGDDSQFDGTWAIWDEPFLQYGEECMDNLEEPFISTIFTATSHHPFRIPGKYEGCFDKGTVPIHKCIGYTDMSLRKFFQTASSAPWFGNTLFVITGDHTNETDRPEYLSGYGLYEIPILFYRPDGSLKGLREGVAQQTDIMPTVLSYLGYDKPYVCFGCDLLSTPDGETWAVSYSEGTYQFITDSLSIQFDGEKAIGAYDYRKDPLQKDDLLELRQEEVGEALPKLKSIIQQYICRMLEDRLTN